MYDVPDPDDLDAAEAALADALRSGDRRDVALARARVGAVLRQLDETQDTPPED
jgi:hypothetical protein